VRRRGRRVERADAGGRQVGLERLRGVEAGRGAVKPRRMGGLFWVGVRVLCQMRACQVFLKMLLFVLSELA
jgi:hypothetical protein